MKHLISCLFLLLPIAMSGQDTLYLPVPSLGYEQFLLFDNGQFTYDSQLCGSIAVSYGTYRMKNGSYIFHYQPWKCPHPNLVELKSESSTDSIRVRFIDMLDSTAFDYIGRIIIGELFIHCDTTAILIPKSQLKSNEILVIQDEELLSFTFDPTSAILLVYMKHVGFGYSCGAERPLILKKKRRGFLEKITLKEKIQRKIRHKGKKVYKYYYQFSEGV